MAAKKKITKKSPATKRAPAKAKKRAAAPKRAAPKKPAPKRASSTSAKRKNTRVVRKTKRPALRPKARAKKLVIKSAVPLNEEALKLARMVAQNANDKKALDVLILDVRRRGASVGYDYVVLATAESDRQLEALADSTLDVAKTVNRNASGVETSPDWVLVNFDDVVVHYFTPDKRETYDLEGLWSDAPRIGATG